MSNGLLGKSMSSNTSNIVLYTVPATAEFATVTVAILNQDTTDRNFDLIITSGSPSAVDYIEKTATIPAKGVYERTCLVLSPGEKIIVYADTNLMSVRVFGLEQPA
jgi:hypothetical protein